VLADPMVRAAIEAFPETELVEFEQRSLTS
jgi:hypothetical protein